MLAQTGSARRRPPPVLFLRTGGGWRLMGLLVARADELRACLKEADDIDTQENVDAFVCVAARDDARRIDEHLGLGAGAAADADAGLGEHGAADGHAGGGDPGREVAFCAGALSGERLSGVAGPASGWAPSGALDPQAERIGKHLAGLLL